MGLSPGPTIRNLSMLPPIPNNPQTGGAPIIGTQPGNIPAGTPTSSYTGGSTDSYNSYSPDLCAGDYMYPWNVPFYNDIQEQWETAGNGWQFEVDSCLAHALSTTMQVMEYKKRGVQYDFSYGWIYGNRISFQNTAIVNGEGLDINDTLNSMVQWGVPFWDDWPNCWVYRAGNEKTNWPNFDWSTYPATSEDMFSTFMEKYQVCRPRAAHFKLDGFSFLGPSNTTTMQYYIQQYGCALWWGYNGQDLWTAVENDGIVAYNQANPLDYYTHLMCVRGWKRLSDGKNYWICQNSWGTEEYTNNNEWVTSGHHGFYFVPFDYQRTINLIGISPYHRPATSFNWSGGNFVSQGSGTLYAEDWNDLHEMVMTKLNSRAITRAANVSFINAGDTCWHDTFNQLNSNINLLYGTGIGSKIRGDTVKADDLNKLVTCYNNG